MKTYSSRDGLLWEGERQLGVQEADQLAQAKGYVYAERLAQAFDGRTFGVLPRKTVCGDNELPHSAAHLAVRFAGMTNPVEILAVLEEALKRAFDEGRIAQFEGKNDGN